MHLKMTEAHRKMEMTEAICKLAILARVDVDILFEELEQSGVISADEMRWMQDYLTVREDD